METHEINDMVIDPEPDDYYMETVEELNFG